MKIREDDNNAPRLNMTSLIDVVFLLLIFFMVTTTFEKQAKLKIELPEANSQKQVEAQQKIVISINQKGIIYLNNNELLNSQYETIASGLKRIFEKEGDSKPSIVVRADANVAHKFVVTVMDVLADLEITSISIATTPSE